MRIVSIAGLSSLGTIVLTVGARKPSSEAFRQRRAPEA
jgi:hypothetical protein